MMVMFPLIDFLSNSFISMPSIVIFPPVTSYILQSKLNIVVLPAPDFPTKATVSLAFILKFISFKTGLLS